MAKAGFVGLVVETNDGKQVKFDAPVGSSEAEIQLLASKALRKAIPGRRYDTPNIPQSELAKLPQTQDQILARQGNLEAGDPDNTSRIERAIGDWTGNRRFGERAANFLGDFPITGGIIHGGDALADTALGIDRGDAALALGGALGAMVTVGSELIPGGPAKGAGRRAIMDVLRDEAGSVGGRIAPTGPAPTSLRGAAADIGMDPSLIREPKGALSNVWNGVDNYDDALRMANEGAHLRTTKDGYIMGSPKVTPEGLGDFRAGIDSRMAAANGAGYGWYDRARSSIADVSTSPEQASLLARSGAAYSPKSSPVEETNRALNLHNNMVLTGDSPSIGMPAQFSAARKGYGDIGADGYVSFTPQNINLGKKTGPYANAKDPTVPRSWQAANDGWHGTYMGYSDNPNQMYGDSFQPNEMSFLHGENVLATDRAIQQGSLPPGSMPENFQEVAWVDQRATAYMNKQTDEFLAGKRDLMPTREEALAYANSGVDDALNRYTAGVSREFTPGGGLGEFENIGGDPALNASFSTDMAAVGGGRNAALTSTQMYARPSIEGVGYWNDPVAGLQRNPTFIDRPLVGFQPERYINDKGKEVVGGMAMAERDRGALSLIGRLHGIENMQHGVGANIFIPANSSHRSEQLNGLYFDATASADAIDRATAAGFDVVDNGDGGVVVTKFGAGPGSDNATWSKQQRDGLKAFAKENGGALGRFDANYAPSGLSDGNMVPRPQGEGIATKELLDAADQFPLVEQRLANSSYPSEVAQRNAIRERLAAETGQPLREDAQRLRGLLAQGGIKAVREYVAKNGLKGLPVWIGAILGTNALTSGPAQDRPDGA